VKSESEEDRETVWVFPYRQ